METIVRIPAIKVFKPADQISLFILDRYQATVNAMEKEGRPFKGVIFFGLMLTENGPRVLEYNAIYKRKDRYFPSRHELLHHKLIPGVPKLFIQHDSFYAFSFLA